MRKATVIGVCLATFLAVVFVPMYVGADPAVVIKDFFCGVIDGDGGFAVAEGRISVINDGGTSTVVCKANDVPNSTGQAVQWNFDNTGILCATFAGVTDEWHETVSPSGNLTLQCKINGN